MSTKEAVLSRIGELPDSATLADIRHEIERMEILEACAEGLKNYQQGRCQSHEEVKTLLESWTSN